MKHRKVGRPTKYDPKFCEEIINFFKREPYEEYPIITTYKDGTTKEEIVRKPNSLPTFEGFAVSIGVHRETLLNWMDQNKEFFDAYKMAKDYQKNMLIENALSGLYSQPFSIFTAKNVTDMRDRFENDITTLGEKITTDNTSLRNSIDELIQARDRS